jgi:hypothetical protein
VRSFSRSDFPATPHESSLHGSRQVCRETPSLRTALVIYFRIRYTQRGVRYKPQTQESLPCSPGFNDKTSSISRVPETPVILCSQPCRAKHKKGTVDHSQISQSSTIEARRSLRDTRYTNSNSHKSGVDKRQKACRTSDIQAQRSGAVITH